MIDLADPQFRADPYPFYRRLRERDPVHWSDSSRAWIVTRHHDVRALFTHPSCAHWTDTLESAPAPFLRTLARWLWLLNPRSNSRLFELVRPLFTAAAAEAMRPAIAARAQTLVEELRERAIVDVVIDFADPLTLFVARRLLGIRDRDGQTFDPLARAVMREFEALWTSGMQNQAPPASFAPFARFVAEVEHAGAFLGALGRARSEGDAIEESEVVAFVILFLFAAQENIKSFIANAAIALAEHDEARCELQSRPDLHGAATEELLRFDTPVQFVALRAKDEMILGGRRIRAGDSIFAGIGAANRDPAAFPDPDRIDFHRRPATNLSFGAGAFYCLGAAHARVETQEALGAMLRGFDSIAIESVEWKSFPLVLRGPRSARISVQPLQVRERERL